MVNKLLCYKPPVDEKGNPYWVPVVMKNKDTLVGLLKGMALVIRAYNIPADEAVTPVLGSDRFNDLLPTGQFVHDMSKQEYKEYIKEQLMPDPDNHIENGVTLPYFFQLECSCGNFYGFKSFLSIPENNEVCGLCGKKLIDYTGHEDLEYKFDGMKVDMNKIVKELSAELNLGEGFDDIDYDDNDESETEW